MRHDITVVGLDVSKKKIAVGVLLKNMDQVTENRMIENTPKNIQKEVDKITSSHGIAVFVYEAGPCGYEIYRQITGLGHACVIVAPGLIPRSPTDRVKTDRRDAEKLAVLYRSGVLTEISVPTPEEEAARDLVRAREDVLADRLRARNRLSKFLLRQGRSYPHQNAIGSVYRQWLASQKFEWEALHQTFDALVRALDEAVDRLESLDRQVEDLAQKDPYRVPVQYLRCLKGVDTLSALTLVVETRGFTRFESARNYMGFTGLVSCEKSSGEKTWRGNITKAGNAHLRRILVEAAWSNRHPKSIVSHELKLRRRECPSAVLQIAKKAQDRLHRKYWRMVGRGKNHGKAVTAVARELSGFVWAIGRQASAHVLN